MDNYYPAGTEQCYSVKGEVYFETTQWSMSIIKVIQGAAHHTNHI